MKDMIFIPKDFGEKLVCIQCGRYVDDSDLAWQWVWTDNGRPIGWRHQCVNSTTGKPSSHHTVSESRYKERQERYGTDQ